MELVDFLRQTQEEVRTETDARLESFDGKYPYAETVFADVVMEHMSEIGMTFEPKGCHYSAKVGNANLKLSGYALSDEADQLDLFVSLYSGVNEIIPVPDSETKSAADQCLRFLKRCAESRLSKTMDESNDAYELTVTIEGAYADLDQIRVYVLTDRQAKSKNFQPQEVAGKTIKLEVMDIERLFRHWSEGKPRDELVVDFEEVSGSPLPCVYIPGEAADYDYALTVFPAEALRFMYEKYGPRLLEANVRAFLSATTKVNRGIRDTLRFDPEKFMAYNNGIVVVADEAQLASTADGGIGIRWLKGMQIVNGGQTTASIYFAKKKNSEIDLSRARVPAKVIILRSTSAAAEEALISDISKYANSQTAVKMSDLSANRPFHIELEKLATTTYLPDGVGRWFYERAAGSYNVMLAREGTTSARLKNLKAAIPTSRKVTKTDLAKFLNVWDQKPEWVSQGTQKNFLKFMESIDSGTGTESLDVAAYKRMIGKAILFKKMQSIARSLCRAFQGNVTTYTIALLANRVGNELDFEKLWIQQDLSSRLQQQLRIWAPEVEKVLQDSADGKMISEWAKKPECWSAVRQARYSPLLSDIPEIIGS